MQVTTGKFYLPKRKWISSPDSFCDQVKYNFPEYLKNGFYKSVGEGMFIIHIRGQRSYRGIIAHIPIEDYRTGQILKHEDILPARHQAAMDRVIQRQALIKPTLLTYQPVVEIDRILTAHMEQNSPVLILDFDYNREQRSYWLVQKGSPDHMALSQLFETRVEHAYIADGHHRFAAIDWLNRHQSFHHSILSSLYSFDEMSIHDYNRIVEKPPRLSPASLIAQISKYLNITPLNQAWKPQRKYELSMKLGGEWYRLTWRNKWIKKAKTKDPFDAYLLNQLILKNIFGIEDVRIDSRVHYISGIHGLEQVEAKMNEQKVAFLLFPIQIKDLTDALDHHELLPPKSTWFEPRTKNGIVVDLLINNHNNE